MCPPAKVQVSVSNPSSLKDVGVSPTSTAADFYWDDSEEPHAARRKLILQKYPEIKKLYGHDPMTKYTVLGLVALQVGCAIWAARASTPGWAFFVVAYVIGGTANHMLMLAMHELSHNLAFKKVLHNKMFGLFANLPIGVPSSVTFKRYHIEHHKYQGEHAIDADIPTELEGKWIQNSFTKFLFVLTQIFFYALRPMIVNPKKPGLWELYNWICCISFNVTMVLGFGKWTIIYLLMSSFLGSGLHPVAGHFIAEHYVFEEGHETYSYYGILNIFAFNVGYHNEHHDFPFVAGCNLPQVREIAKEFYDPLPQCKSWVMVQWNYIMDPTITPFSRVKRHTVSPEDFKRLNPHHLKTQ